MPQKRSEAKALKPETQSIPFGDRVVVETLPFGKKGWEPEGTDASVLKATPWPAETWILLQDGDIQQASTPVPVIQGLPAPKEPPLLKYPSGCVAAPVGPDGRHQQSCAPQKLRVELGPDPRTGP